MKNIVIDSNSKGKSPLKILKLIGFGIIIIALLIAFGGVIKLLWNSLMPDIFGLKEISYFQGIGLLLLSRILIGGFGSDKTSNKSSNKGGYTIQAGPVIVEKKNSEEEDNYEAWWSSEGESAFEAYNEKNKSDSISSDLE